MQENLCLANSVVLHIAEPVHIPEIYELVDTYRDGMIIDKDLTKESLRDIVYDEGVILIEYNDMIVGGIAGYVMPCMFTHDQIYSVMFFYILPSFRFLTRDVMKEIELVVLPTHATKIVFGVPAMYKNPKALARFYRRMGYKPLETHYEKRIV